MQITESGGLSRRGRLSDNRSEPNCQTWRVHFKSKEIWSDHSADSQLSGGRRSWMAFIKGEEKNIKWCSWVGDGLKKGLVCLVVKLRIGLQRVKGVMTAVNPVAICWLFITASTVLLDITALKRKQEKSSLMCEISITHKWGGRWSYNSCTLTVQSS